MARFLDEDLRPFVIGDGHRYRLRSLDGRSLPMSRALLEQLAKARTIRQAFFADDPSEPGVRFTLAPYSLDPTVSRATLRFGDQQMEYRHGPIVPMLFQWPTTVEDGRSSLVLEGMAQQPMGIEKTPGHGPCSACSTCCKASRRMDVMRGCSRPISAACAPITC